MQQNQATQTPDLGPPTRAGDIDQPGKGPPEVSPDQGDVVTPSSPDEVFPDQGDTVDPGNQPDEIVPQQPDILPPPD